MLYFKTTILFLAVKFHGTEAYFGGRLRGIGQTQSVTSTTTKIKRSSDLTTLWYKPHHQCGTLNDDGTSNGSTPQQAADFINSQLDAGVDFAAVSEYQPTVNDPPSIGNPADYGTIGAACGYQTTSFPDPVVIFYKLDSWELDSSYPPSKTCHKVPLAPWNTSAEFGPDACFDAVEPGDDNCCSCVYSKEEFNIALGTSNNMYQRGWAAGLFSSKKNGSGDEKNQKVCIVAASLPHPLSNDTVTNLNNATLTSEPNPYTIDRNGCTSTSDLSSCVVTPMNTSVVYGTDVLVSKATEFCQGYPMIFMADTNANMGYVGTGSMFLQEPMSLLEDASWSSPYTCCNDTDYGKGLNSFASDRLAVTRNNLVIDLLEGGGAAPQGPILTDDLNYQCHVKEEHTPLRAHISFQ